MRSFKHKHNNRRQVYLALVGQIESQLREAYAKRHEQAGETQSSLADKLGVNRSAVHKRLTGQTNMTIKTIADMVWALGYCIKVDIFAPDEVFTNGKLIVPSFEGAGTIQSSASIVKSMPLNKLSASDWKTDVWLNSGSRPILPAGPFKRKSEIEPRSTIGELAHVS